MRSKSKCSVCPAIHTKSRSWLRSSSTREPSDPPLRVVSFFCGFQSVRTKTTPKSVHLRLLALTRFCSGCKRKMKTGAFFFIFLPKGTPGISHSISKALSVRKKKKSDFSQNPSTPRKRSSKSFVRKKVDAPFVTRGLFPVHFKVSRNRGSRGSPLGASSKGTEATLFGKTAHPNHGVFCAVPTAYKLGRVGARLYGFSNRNPRGTKAETIR